eukprot:12825621-Ditylum_brightwellii.AAC.1
MEPNAPTTIVLLTTLMSYGTAMSISWEVLLTLSRMTMLGQLCSSASSTTILRLQGVPVHILGNFIVLLHETKWGADLFEDLLPLVARFG